MNTQRRRCAVISDNGQRISREDKVVMDSNTLKKNKLILRLKDYIKNCKSVFVKTKTSVVLKYEAAKSESPENVKKLRNTAVTAVCAGVFICASSVFFTAGYDVYLNGEHMGIVTEKEDFESIVTEVNEVAAEISHSSYGSVWYKPSYIMKISLRSHISDADTLRKNVANMSDAVRYGSTLILDGTAAFTVEDQELSQKAIDDVVNSYGSDNAKILTDIKFANEYVEKDVLEPYDEAYLKLRNILKVETVKNVAYNEDIPYGTTTVEDSTMYIGEQEIATSGTVGTQKVVANVTYINGVEASRDIISTEEITPAASETVIVGTKERPSHIGTGVMMLPFSGNVSSRYGARDGRRTSHKGVDLSGKSGSPVAAADNGTVINAEYRSDYGNIVIVDHNNGLSTYYAHLSKINVNVGDVVEKGDTVGLVGSTGISTGPHLHFEVRRNGEPINPYTYIN